MSKHLTIDGNRYNNTMYEPRRFNSLVSALAAILPAMLKAYGASHIAIQGKSGIAVAFAIAAQVEIGIIVVRKEGENSHGSKVESNGKPITGYMFFDDFISSGATQRRVVRELELYADLQGVRPPELKGSISWARSQDTDIDLSILQWGRENNLITQEHMAYLCYED